MTRKAKNVTVAPPTLDQIEAAIAEFGGALTGLSEQRKEILNREKLERLQALEADLATAIKHQSTAQEKRAKASEAVEKAQEQLNQAKEVERQVAQDLSMAQLAVRQTRHQIDLLHSDLQS